LTGRPLHGSGRAGLPHPAPVLGDNAKTMQRIRMIVTDRRQVPIDQTAHPIPTDPSALAAPRQGARPEPSDLESEDRQRRSVHRDSMVMEVTFHDRTEPPAHLWDRVMHSPFQLALTAWDPNGSRDGDPPGVAFRLLLQRRRPRGKSISRLNTRPARTPVNASPVSLRTPTHDSGPSWAANPSTYDSFIHNTLPV